MINAYIASRLTFGSGCVPLKGALPGVVGECWRSNSLPSRRPLLPTINLRILQVD